MKRLLSFLLLITLALITARSIAAAQTTQTQSLGDYARGVKKQKSTASRSSSKVYDNDNLPGSAAVSVVGKPADGSPDNNAMAKSPDAQPAEVAKDADKKAEPQIKAGQPLEERKKAVDAWKTKLDGQKDKITLLSHDLDVSQREYQVKAAEFYANTTRRVNNPTAFNEDDAKYKHEIADKQKALDEAKEKLSDMQEEARKEGVPNSVTE